MNYLTILIAAGVAVLLVISVCCIVALGQLHRLVEGVNQILDLAVQVDERQKAIMANIRSHDFDPQ